MVANKLFEILSTIFSTVEKKIPKGMVIRYAIRIPVIHFAVSGTMVTEICQSLKSMEDEVTEAPIQHLRAKVTAPGFSAPDEEITDFSPSNQKLLLSWSVETKLGSTPRHQDPSPGNLENKPASPQDWQPMMDLSLIKEEVVIKILWRWFLTVSVYVVNV